MAAARLFWCHDFGAGPAAALRKEPWPRDRAGRIGETAGGNAAAKRFWVGSRSRIQKQGTDGRSPPVLVSRFWGGPCGRLKQVTMAASCPQSVCERTEWAGSRPPSPPCRCPNLQPGAGGTYGHNPLAKRDRGHRAMPPRRLLGTIPSGAGGRRVRECDQADTWLV